jgi:hypothetical protein
MKLCRLGQITTQCYVGEKIILQPKYHLTQSSKDHAEIHKQSIANLHTRQAHQLGCFVYTEGIFAPKLCGQVVDVFLDGQLKSSGSSKVWGQGIRLHQHMGNSLSSL